MKNLFQKEFLNSLLDNYEFAYNKLRREELIANFSRLKDHSPFSPRLNEWIIDWYGNHKDIFVFTDFDDFNGINIKETLNLHLERFKSTGKILIWTGSNSNSIYGTNENLMLHCWHDHTHITHNCGFSFAGESMVAAIQASMLPEEWVLEKELITIDIVGQNQYFGIHKEFVKDQRKFVIDYLKSTSDAIFTKQN